MYVSEVGDEGQLLHGWNLHGALNYYAAWEKRGRRVCEGRAAPRGKCGLQLRGEMGMGRRIQGRKRRGLAAPGRC